MFSWLSLGQALCVFWVGRGEPWTLWFMIKEESTQLQPNSELSPFLYYNFLCGKKGTTRKSCRPQILGRLTSYPLFLVLMPQALFHPPKTQGEPVPGYGWLPKLLIFVCVKPCNKNRKYTSILRFPLPTVEMTQKGKTIDHQPHKNRIFNHPSSMLV